MVMTDQGTFIIKNESALQSLVHRYPDTPFLLEDFIPFERELAVIAARGVTGEIVSYPMLETQQEDNVCRRVFTSNDVSANTQDICKSIAHQLLVNLDTVGLFAIELFATPDGKVLVNEIAPRTHNSGHLTIEACATSQFEQISPRGSGVTPGEYRTYLW